LGEKSKKLLPELEKMGSSFTRGILVTKVMEIGRKHQHLVLSKQGDQKSL
jgi:hypothetical protein